MLPNGDGGRTYKIWVDGMPLAEEFTTWDDAALMAKSNDWGHWDGPTFRLRDGVRIKAVDNVNN